jgi:uncharacterized iron-regulated membrane protein
LIPFIESVHFNLYLDKIGRTINGIGAMLLVMLGLSGVMIWWRGTRRLARHAVIGAPLKSKVFLLPPNCELLDETVTR